jgi:hypothetical protein
MCRAFSLITFMNKSLTNVDFQIFNNLYVSYARDMCRCACGSSNKLPIIAVSVKSCSKTHQYQN